MSSRLERVLLVEDEEDIRVLVRMSLELAGISVHECASGADALACVRSVNPQLVLCDMMLPGMAGTEVLARLRKDPATAALPVVFLTAKVQPDEIESYRKQGAAGVLRKPFDPVELGNALARIWQDLGR